MKRLGVELYGDMVGTLQGADSAIFDFEADTAAIDRYGINSRILSAEVDVAVFGERADDTEALLSIGEVKWNDVMDIGHLERLQRIRHLLSAKFDTTDTRLACYSAAGFIPALHTAAEKGEVLLIGLGDLYR